MERHHDGWFTDAMPDLNQENPLVARYLIENALWWVETANLDGVRLDTFPYVDRAFWHEFHATLHSVYPHLTTVARSSTATPRDFVLCGRSGATRHRHRTRYTVRLSRVFFSARCSDSWQTDDGPGQSASQDSLYPHPSGCFIYRQPRYRALYDRSRGSAAKLKLALGLVSTLRGMPQIYSG